MAEFLSTLYQSPSYFFLALGGILLLCELFGANGYALWSGVAAILTGLIALIAPLFWTVLWVIFACLTLISAYLWWLWLTKFDHKSRKTETLNQPQKALIGVKTIVVEPIINGSGRVKIKDGSWSASCRENLPSGTPVRVVDVDGLTLKVEKCD
ncbi:NfeD family protein [Orbaceae bacterium ESL0721]|nr:NfeD family protein [Orbaceae bacterium ESL0721]